MCVFQVALLILGWVGTLTPSPLSLFHTLTHTLSLPLSSLFLLPRFPAPFPLTTSHPTTHAPPLSCPRPQCVQALLEDPTNRVLCDAAGRSAAHLAAAYGEIACLQVLIQSGVDCRCVCCPTPPPSCCPHSRTAVALSLPTHTTARRLLCAVRNVPCAPLLRAALTALGVFTGG